MVVLELIRRLDGGVSLNLIIIFVFRLLCLS